jgi:hypothetical protein
VTWQLVSSSGRERVVWTARGVDKPGDDAELVCDIALTGRFYGATFDAAPPGALPDFNLTVRGLAVRVSNMRRLHDHVRGWLDLSPAEMRRNTLAIDCAMGSLYDQDLRLILGRRDDTLSAGHPVATVRCIAGRLKGELSFVTDPNCLAALCDGLRAAMASQ